MKPQRDKQFTDEAQRFAACVLASLDAEKDTELGKLFGRTITVRPDGERVYDGIMKLGGTVYRLGLMTDGSSLHGIVNEHDTREQQRADFLKSLEAVGLTMAEAESARYEISLAMKEGPAPRFCRVPERDIQAIIKTLESGLCQEGLLLVRRLLKL